MKFVVDELALGQVFSKYFEIASSKIIPPKSHGYSFITNAIQSQKLSAVGDIT
jgi:hypothetical protein